MLLAELEAGDRGARSLADLPLFAAAPPLPPAALESEADPLREALGALDPDALTPREAMAALYRLKALGAQD